VLSIYIAHSVRPHLLSVKDEDDLHLRDVIMNFLIAGRDTTGQTLQWLFYELSQHRE
jgi:cytochrome P450